MALPADTSITETLKKPEAWAPLGGLLSAVGGMAAGARTVQWARAVVLVAAVGYGIYRMVKRESARSRLMGWLAAAGVALATMFAAYVKGRQDTAATQTERRLETIKKARKSKMKWIASMLLASTRVFASGCVSIGNYCDVARPVRPSVGVGRYHRHVISTLESSPCTAKSARWQSKRGKSSGNSAKQLACSLTLFAEGASTGYVRISS